MVNVEHHQASKLCGRLLAPRSFLATLGSGLVKHGLEDEGRQLAFQFGIARLTESVNHGIALLVSYQFIEQLFVHWLGRIKKVSL